MNVDLHTQNVIHTNGLNGIVVRAGQGDTPDLGGPKLESLCDTDSYCVIKGTIPPGVAVPLHSHSDPESFYVLSGESQILTQIQGALTWQQLQQGDFAHIPAGTKHAWRNVSHDGFEAIVITTPKLGRFLRELGDAANHSPEGKQRLSERYGYWMGNPEENAAVGIVLPS